MNRLVIIDGHAILHRAFHALPPLTDPQGEPVNAVYGFTSMLLRIIQDMSPDYLAVVFDRPTPTFRKKLYPLYQSQRPKMDDDLVPQIQKMHEMLEQVTVRIYEQDGYEADDVIGTIVKQVNQTLDIVVVTGDKDLFQLVDSHTRVYMPVKGLSESVLYGEKEVEIKMGVLPSQIIDYKALVGDPSDNYPGVQGIGPKTAVTLLHTYGTLEQLYAHVSDIKSETIRNKLNDKKDDALMSQQLATVCRDVPLSFHVEECTLPSFSSPSAIEAFRAFGFRSLIQRITGVQMDAKKSVKKKKEEKSSQGALF